MYDIAFLEKEWKRYKKRKRRPFMIVGFVIVLLGGGIAFLYQEKDLHISSLWKDYYHTIEKVEPEKLSFVSSMPLTEIEVKTEEKPQVIENSEEIVEDLPLADDRPIRKKPRVKMNIVTTEMSTIQHDEKEKPHQRKYLAIKESNSVSAYREVAERFRETKDTDDSLFLARTYYKMRKYKKAAYWALQTNNVDSTIEESILIFVKAKVKLGHKNEAIRILAKYVKGSNSPEARLLLKEIKKGKL